MALKIYNSLTRKIEKFTPIEAGKVAMYSCGPTVYDYFHIGNARTFLVAELIRCYLEFKGYEVKFVQNITDIDDKIIDRANEQKTDINLFCKKYIEAYFADAESLGILPATIHPCATEHIPEIVQLIEKLIEGSFAYEVDGDVFYRIDSFPEYGKLSHRVAEDLRAGARVEVDRRKENPRDFDLWKKSKVNEPSWKSPWSDGRPGWHTECAVMAMKYLGETIDIHAGGQDLLFPHHENEIAQVEAITGKPFANYWVHTAFLQLDGNKMGKSDRNFVFLRDALSEHSPETVRHFLISAHYRDPLELNENSLIASQSAVQRLKNCLKSIEKYASMGPENRQSSSFLAEFEEAMDNDFNTAKAIGVIFKFVSEINKFVAVRKNQELSKSDRIWLGNAHDELLKVCKLLGIYADRSEKKSEENSKTVEGLMKIILGIRDEARAKKDWSIADKIRDELSLMNIKLEDSQSGTTWKFS